MDNFDRLEKLLERIADGIDALAGNRLEHFSDMIQRIALSQQDIKHNFAHTASLVSVQNLHDEVGDVLVRLGELEATVALLHAKVFDVASIDQESVNEFDPFADPFLTGIEE